MILITSALFVLLIYGCMGFQLLGLLARHWAPHFPFAYVFVFQLVATALWLLLALGVYFAARFYEGMLYHREGSHKRLKPWLEVNGCRGLGFIGGIATVAAGIWLGMNGKLPHTHWPLVAVMGFTFLDGFKPSRWPRFSELFPPPLPRFEIPELLLPKTHDHAITLSWSLRIEDEERKSFNVVCGIHDSTYQAARERERFPRSPVSEYCRYVREGGTDEIRELATWFRQETDKAAMSPVQEVMNVVEMTRSIAYALDLETHTEEDYADFPVELLVEQEGDCEDHAILACCVLWLLGHDVGLVYLKGESEAHLALGYHHPNFKAHTVITDKDGTAYHYIETVPGSSELGEVSDEFLSSMPELAVFPV